MIIEHLAELQRVLERDLADGIARWSECREQMTRWDNHNQEKASELCDLKEIIRNAQTSKEHSLEP